jgi:hypothetical protein
MNRTQEHKKKQKKTCNRLQDGVTGTQNEETKKGNSSIGKQLDNITSK